MYENNRCVLPAKQQIGQFALLVALLTFVVIVKVDVIKVYLKCNTDLSLTSVILKWNNNLGKVMFICHKLIKKYFKVVQRMRKDSGKHNNTRINREHP